MRLAPTPGNQVGEWTSPIKTDPFSVSIPEKVALLLAANEAAAKVKRLRPDPRLVAFTDFCHVLLNSNEFLYVE